MHWPYFFFYGNQVEMYDEQRVWKEKKLSQSNVTRINEYIFRFFLLTVQYVNDYSSYYWCLCMVFYQLLLMSLFFLLDTASRITTNKGCDWKWQPFPHANNEEENKTLIYGFFFGVVIKVLPLRHSSWIIRHFKWV